MQVVLNSHSDKLVVQLERSELKVKKLRLRAHCQEKQLTRQQDKEARMKEVMGELLSEIK